MINLTPHAVVIEDGNGKRVTIPPSGTVARVATEETIISSVEISGATIPVVARRFGQVIGLPTDNHQACLVSALVLEAVMVEQPWRRQVYAPDTGPTAIRDDSGRVVAVRRLVGVSP